MQNIKHEFNKQTVTPEHLFAINNTRFNCGFAVLSAAEGFGGAPDSKTTVEGSRHHRLADWASKCPANKR